jgi:hypothetical protein
MSIVQKCIISYLWIYISLSQHLWSVRGNNVENLVMKITAVLQLNSWLSPHYQQSCQVSASRQQLTVLITYTWYVPHETLLMCYRSKKNHCLVLQLSYTAQKNLLIRESLKLNTILFWHELAHKNCEVNIAPTHLWINCKTQVNVNAYMLRLTNDGSVPCRATTLLAWDVYIKETAPTHTLLQLLHTTPHLYHINSQLYNVHTVYCSTSVKQMSSFLEDMVPHEWVFGTQCYETVSQSHLQGSNIQWKSLQSTFDPMTWCHIPEEWRPQIHHCKSLKPLMCRVIKRHG